MSTPACTTAALAVSALLIFGRAFAAPDIPAMAPENAELKAQYWLAHEALQDGHWDTALARFIDLEQRLRKSDAALADAAVYWQAYALAHSKRFAEARANVERLHRNFPQSLWSDEADALVLKEVRSLPDTPGAGDSQAEAVIERAISAPAGQAAPSLMQIMNGDYSLKVKKRALFVASQLGDPGSSMRLVVIANGADPELSREAIQMLGVSGASSELLEVYSAASSEDTQRAALRALGIAGGVDALAEVASSNADMSARCEAIKNLGVAGGTERLLELYGNVDAPELRRAVIAALRVGADNKTLLEIYERAKTPRERQVLMSIQQEIGDGNSAKR